MPKLQKRSPPAYPGLRSAADTGARSFEGGIRYESLPQDTRQPVPLAASENQAAISGALASNNPYNAVRYQSSSPPPATQIVSPVSPMMDTPAPQSVAPATRIHAPQPQRPGSDARKSVELRRLDGTPYSAEQPKKVKVARDMHEGALPPAYRRQASDPIQPTAGTPVARSDNPPPPHHCSRCGKRQTTVGQQGQTDTCTNCGKHKSIAPSQPRASSAPHSRVVSESVPSVPRASPTSPTVAGPSVGPRPHAHCHKCGKMKKPATTPLQQQQFGQPVPQGPSSAPLPGARLTRPQRPGISIQQAPQVMQGVNPQIDVIPPSASTYRPNSIQSPFSNYADETPLVGRASKQEFKLFRNSSLIRSLSRRMSGRDKRASDGPLPSQQLRASQADDGEQGTGRLINMISKAINESGDENSQQYSRLHIQEQPDRPSSPFSFMETPDEDQAFEMTDMRDKDETGPVTSPASAKSAESMYSPVVISETLDVDVDRRSKLMEQQNPRQSPNGLTVPGQEGSTPPLTRFKSLRKGVNRAASVTRTTSLRRLESLKTVHKNWYRDDMAIEGHNGESIPVF